MGNGTRLRRKISSWRLMNYTISKFNLTTFNTMLNIYLQFVHTVQSRKVTETVRKICTSYQLYKEVPKNLKGRSKSSQEWLTRQLADPYVEKAKVLNYRYYSVNNCVGYWASLLSLHEIHY